MSFLHNSFHFFVFSTQSYTFLSCTIFHLSLCLHICISRYEKIVVWHFIMVTKLSLEYLPLSLHIMFNHLYISWYKEIVVWQAFCNYQNNGSVWGMPLPKQPKKSHYWRTSPHISFDEDKRKTFHNWPECMINYALTRVHNVHIWVQCVLHIDMRMCSHMGSSAQDGENEQYLS